MPSIATGNDRPVRREDVSALVLGAGMGLRMGLGPKAFLCFAHETLVERAVAAVAPFAAEIIVGVPPEDENGAREMLGGASALCLPAGTSLHVFAGGSTRQETVTRLLKHATKPLILLHEVARPFVTAELFEQVLSAAAEAGGASLCLPLEARDSVGVARGGELETCLPRNTVFTLQCPHGYRRDVLIEAHRRAAAEGWSEEGTAALVRRAGYRVRLVQGSAANIKLTYRADLSDQQLVMLTRPAG